MWEILLFPEESQHPGWPHSCVSEENPDTPTANPQCVYVHPQSHGERKESEHRETRATVGLGGSPEDGGAQWEAAAVSKTPKTSHLAETTPQMPQEHTSTSQPCVLRIPPAHHQPRLQVSLMSEHGAENTRQHTSNPSETIPEHFLTVRHWVFGKSPSFPSYRPPRLPTLSDDPSPSGF